MFQKYSSRTAALNTATTQLKFFSYYDILIIYISISNNASLSYFLAFQQFLKLNYAAKLINQNTNSKIFIKYI